jgi:salicylate 5-hydroxylase small subunit
LSTAPTGARPPIASLDWTDYQALLQLYSDYASAVDSNDWDLWPQFFTEDCVYRIVPRENDERGLPLATVDFDSRGMLLDRVYGIKETLFHDPYYQRHVVGTPVVRSVDGDAIRAEANYAVFRTKLSEPSMVYNVGRYRDVVVRTGAGLRFRERVCVYDTELIPNSIIYPI